MGRAPRALRRSALVLAALACLAGALVRDAVAQPAAEAGSVDERSVDLSPPVATGAEPERSLSSEQHLVRAKAFVMAIESSAQSILRQLQAARKDRDVVRVLCLNDKLNQVDVALRSAQDRQSSLKSAAERADADRARHEYTVLEVLNDRVRVLVNEANQCVGEETGFVGEAEVSVSIDPNLPDANTGFGPDFYSLPPPPNISSPVE
jgi:hypothetical protein